MMYVRVRKPELAEFPYSYIHHLCLFFLSLDAEQDRDGTRQRRYKASCIALAGQHALFETAPETWPSPASPVSDASIPQNAHIAGSKSLGSIF